MSDTMKDVKYEDISKYIIGFLCAEEIVEDKAITDFLNDLKKVFPEIKKYARKVSISSESHNEKVIIIESPKTSTYFNADVGTGMYNKLHKQKFNKIVKFVVVSSDCVYVSDCRYKISKNCDFGSFFEDTSIRQTECNLDYDLNLAKDIAARIDADNGVSRTVKHILSELGSGEKEPRTTLYLMVKKAEVIIENDNKCKLTIPQGRDKLLHEEKNSLHKDTANIAKNSESIAQINKDILKNTNNIVKNSETIEQIIEQINKHKWMFSILIPMFVNIIFNVKNIYWFFKEVICPILLNNSISS